MPLFDCRNSYSYCQNKQQLSTEGRSGIGDRGKTHFWASECIMFNRHWLLQSIWAPLGCRTTVYSTHQLVWTVYSMQAASSQPACLGSEWMKNYSSDGSKGLEEASKWIISCSTACDLEFSLPFDNKLSVARDLAPPVLWKVRWGKRKSTDLLRFSQ